MEFLVNTQTWLDASQLDLEINHLSQTVDAQIPFFLLFFFLLLFKTRFKITARVNLNGLIQLFAYR